MKLEVGEYVRTNSGYIGKVTEILDGAVVLRVQTERKSVSTIMIKKHSKNILDIIEKGDLIKIKLKFHHKTESIYEWKEAPDNNSATWKRMLEQIESGYYEIVSIITKEEFKNKNIGYKVEE